MKNKKQIIISIKKDIESFLEIEDLSIKSRKRNIITARRIFCYVCFCVFKKGYREIFDVIKVGNANFIYHKDKYLSLIDIKDPDYYDFVLYLIEKYKEDKSITIELDKDSILIDSHRINLKVINTKLVLESVLFRLGYNNININEKM